MWTQGVVEALDVCKYVGLGHGTGGVAREVDQLTFQAAEEIFGHGVVVGVAPAGHALADAVGLQTLTVGLGCVLDAAVTVEDQALGRSAAAVSHVQCRERELGVDSVGECVTDDFLQA